MADEKQAANEAEERGAADMLDEAKAVAPSEHATNNLDLLRGVELPVTLCFGRRRMRLREVLELNAGSVVELDRQVEDPVELLLDGRVIARGEVVVVDGSYGIRVREVIHGVQP